MTHIITVLAIGVALAAAVLMVSMKGEPIRVMISGKLILAGWVAVSLLLKLNMAEMGGTIIVAAADITILYVLSKRR